MPNTKLRLAAILSLGAFVGGCSSLGTEPITTASIGESPKVDPACVTLTSQIDSLRKEGVADKVANAAAKKYKLTAADMTKADQLNKANADFQAKCATITPKPAQQQASLPASAEALAATAVSAAKPLAVVPAAAVAPAVAKKAASAAKAALPAQ